MGMINVSVDTSELTKFKRKLSSLNSLQKTQFYEHASREMAGRLLALVIPRTPVGVSVQLNGRTVSVGGELRRGWLGESAGAAGGISPSPSAVASAANALNVTHEGNAYRITVTNATPYASYVESGHRQTPGRYVPAIGKRLKASWVEGKHFLRISEEELQGASPELLEKMLDDFMRTVF